MHPPRVFPLLEVTATVLLGLMAGFFFAFWVDVAPAMRELEAGGYIQAQQAINRAVRNAPFAIAHFGAALVPWLLVALAWQSGDRRRAGAWAAIAVIYGAGVFLLTRSERADQQRPRAVGCRTATRGMDAGARPLECRQRRARARGGHRLCRRRRAAARQAALNSSVSTSARACAP